MTYKGIVREGGIVLPPGTELPEGAEVHVVVIDCSGPQNGDSSGRTTAEQLLELTRKAEELTAQNRPASTPPTQQSPAEEEPEDGYALNRELLKFAGIVKDLPADFSINHDHYLYGVPKRQ